MPLKTTVKNKEKELDMEKIIFPILVVNNSNLKPYIEVFDYYPENITQQPLGILAGFFEIRDYSEDSAYIVNFLNSVIKKEYYLNPKRSVPESFDNTLHRANLALSEVAKHGNVDWLGKLDSAICAFEKNTIHFSITGSAKILLWRNKILTDITEGLASENPEPHPLKTFTNVSSGKLEKNDKLIITSSDIFNTLSILDIKKNIARFDNEKFSQFLKTAMSNELDVAGTIVVDIEEPEKNVRKKYSATIEEDENEREVANVFSGVAFSDNQKKPTHKTQQTDTNENQKKQHESEYTDKKTGHIYIQGEDEQVDEQNVANEHFQIFKENLYNSLNSFNCYIQRQASLNWRNLKNNIFKPQARLSNKKPLENTIEVINETIRQETIKDFAEKAQTKQVKENDTGNDKNDIEDIEEEYEKKGALEFIVEKYYSISFKIKLWIKKSRLRFSSKDTAKKDESAKEVSQNILLLPSLKRIIGIFTELTTKQKIASITIVLLIITAPLFLSNLKKKENASSQTALTENIQKNDPLAPYRNEKNISFVTSVEKLATVNKGVAIFSLETGIYTVTSDKIISKKDNATEEFALDKSIGNGVSATFMSDLGLIFVVTDSKKILSFSPISKDLKENSILWPENSNPDLIATYMTYLYAVDKKNGEIYRFPRAEGGFGEGSGWLKEEQSDLSEATSISIDENLYISKKQNLLKFFRGKNESFQIEKTTTPISFDLIQTGTDMDKIYVLDKENSRLIKFSKDGSIEKQYHHESIKDSVSFSISEDKQKAYLLSETEAFSLAIN